MPRISKLEPSQVDDQVRTIFEAFLKERGNIPNMFRTVAHRPPILKSMIDHFKNVMGTGTLGPKLKELLFVRVSQINHCDY